MKGINAVSLKKRLLSGSIWSLLFKVLGAVLGLSVYALLARMLTTEDFGIYFLVVSVITFMATIVQAGMSKTALRLIAESLSLANHERATHALRTSLRFIILVGLSVMLLWMIGVNDWVSVGMFHSSQMASLGWLTACWFVLLAVLRYFSEVFRGLQDFFRSSLFSGTATSAISVSLFGIYYLGHRQFDLFTAVQMTLIAVFLAAMVAGVMLHRRFALIGEARLVPVSELWPIAWPILITNLFVFVSNQADLWILGMLVSKDEVAIYGAVLRTVLLITLAPLIINSVIQPMIVELYSKGEKQKLERLLGTTAIVTFVPSIILLVAVIFEGDQFLALVFGQQYADGALVLAILCAGRTVSVFTGSCGQCLMLAGHQKVLMNTTILFASFSIISALMTVKEFGSPAVATCFATGMTLQNITHALLVRKRMGISTFANLKWLTKKNS